MENKQKLAVKQPEHENEDTIAQIKRERKISIVENPTSDAVPESPEKEFRIDDEDEFRSRSMSEQVIGQAGINIGLLATPNFLEEMILCKLPDKKFLVLFGGAVCVTCLVLGGIFLYLNFFDS